MSYLPKLSPSVTRGLGGIPSPTESLDYSGGELHMSEYPIDNSWLDADGSIVLQADYPETYEAFGQNYPYVPMGTLLPTPATIPGTTANTIAMTSDAGYVMAGNSISPRLLVYKRTGTSLVKLPNPAAGIFPTTPKGPSFSGDSSYLIVGASGVSPYIFFYKIVSDTLVKAANPSVLPSDVADTAASYDASYVAFAVFSQGVYVYKRNGDIFEKLASPSDSTTTSFVTMSSDGVFTIGASGSTMHCYERDGDFYKPRTTVTGTGSSTYTAISISGDGRYLAAANSGSAPWGTIFKRNTETNVFEFLTYAPVTGSSAYCSINEDGTLVVFSSGGSVVETFQRTGDTFRAVATTVSTVPGTLQYLTLSADSSHTAFGHPVTPWFSVYKSDENYNLVTEFQLPTVTTDVPTRVKAK